MLRLLILYLCILSIEYADISSSNPFFFVLLPAINFCFLVYILITPFLFLYRKGLMGKYSNTETSERLNFMLAAFFQDIRYKYHDKFLFLGPFSFLGEVIAFIVELGMMAYLIFSYYAMVIGQIA